MHTPATLDATPTTLVTPPQGLATPAPHREDAPLPLPPSGFRQAVRTTGRALGYATMPIWWPLAKWTEVMGSGVREVLDTPRALKAQAQAHLTKIRTDAALWESWTPEQRASVVRQQVAWTGLLLAGSLLALALPSPWNLVPILSVSSAWWLRGHALPGLEARWDLARWMLRLPQVQHIQQTEAPTEEVPHA